MAEKKKKRTTDKWKKKMWYEIFSPGILDKKKIGETVAEKPELLMGRVLTVSARDLGAPMKKGQYMLNFKVDNVQGTKAYTELRGHTVLISMLKRLIRRRSSKVETVQEVLSRDDKKVRIKTVVITLNKVSRDTRTDLRKVAEDFIKKTAKKTDYDKMVYSFIFGDGTQDLYVDLKKVVPVKRVEIIKSKVLN